jgi:hypothetical protein
MSFVEAHDEESSAGEVGLDMGEVATMSAQLGDDGG